MKATLALGWKEFRQVRWFLFWGLMVFLMFPLIEAAAKYQRGRAFRTDMPEGIVLCLGGFFAIFTAVGVVCPELKKGLFVFWRSKPVAIWKWILLKYSIGLFVVLIVCIIPIIMELALHHFASPNRQQDFVYTALNSHTFTIILIYSLSFLIGCLVRKTTHAAILSFAIMLLVYFLPVLVPPLERLSIINLMSRFKTPFRIGLAEAGSKFVEEGLFGASKERWGYGFGFPKWAWMRLPGGKALIIHYLGGYFFFILTMLGMSLISVVLSALAIIRNWRVKMEQKLLCWSLGIVVLLIFSTVGFALGSNLTCQQRIELVPKGDYKHMFYVNGTSSGNHGLAIYGVYDREAQMTRPKLIKQYDVVNDNVAVYDYSLQDVEMHSIYGRNAVEYSHYRPDIVWTLQTHYEKLDDSSHKRTLWLVTLELQKESKQVKVLSKLKLGEHISKNNSAPGGSSIELHDDKIYAYVYGKLYVVNVSDPAIGQVTLLDENYGGPVYGESGSSGKTTRTLRLFKDDTLTYQQRLQVTLGLMDYRIMASDDKTFVDVKRDVITVFKLVSSEGDKVLIESDTFRRPTPLERIMDLSPRDVHLKNGLLYVLATGGLGQGVTVYDIRTPGQVKKVAHYAAPDERFEKISLLEDGRLLVIGNSLHIILSPEVR